MVQAGLLDVQVIASPHLAATVATLLALNADPSIATTQATNHVPAGSTPLSIAQAMGHADVVRVLNGELHYCYAAKCAKPGHRSCARCKQAWYCERKCQLRDWPTHKLVCGSAAAASLRVVLSDVELWSVARPYMYSVDFEVLASGTVDAVTVDTGFKSVDATPRGCASLATVGVIREFARVFLP